MPKLFGIDIAGIINQNMGKGLLSVQLTKSTAGTRTSGQLNEGTNPTTLTYSGRGFISDYKDTEMANTSIRTSDKKIAILGASLPNGIIPIPGDSILVEGNSYNVVNVKRDPAAAIYICQSRG